jgi:hypothetical protein
MKLLLLSLLALPLVGGMVPDPSQDPAQDALIQTFSAAGIHLDFEARTCAIPVQVEIRDDLLEYLLTLPHGQAHEAMFIAGRGLPSAEEALTWAETFNAALLALGVQPGKNAEWVDKDPAPTQEQVRAGTSPYEVRDPEGDGFYLYAAWKTKDELYLFRVEDLVRDLESQRTMRRHRWVYLGSRLVERSKGGQVFAAGLEGNLVNISYFPQGNTVLTGALPECLNQTTWLPNAWLLPERGAQVLLIFSRERLSGLPASLEQWIPTVRSSR